MSFDESLKKEILNQWEERVRSALPIANEQPSYALRDNLPSFLDNLFNVLTNQPSSNDIVEAKSLSEIHGIERALIQKYTLAQVHKEYSILRSVILKILSRQSPLSIEDHLVIHRMIDDAETTAVVAFEEIRAQSAQELATEIHRRNEDLQQFASVAAHDLRAPLATVYSYIAYIQDEVKDPSPDVKEGFEFMKTSINQLLQLIEKLLIYAKAGTAVPNIENVNLNHLLNDVMSSLGKSIFDTRAQIIFQGLPTIQSDPILLKQLFQNLLNNSLKFKSNEPPRIEIKLESEDEFGRTFSLQDNGIGFEPEQAKKIFQPFTRLHGEGIYQGSGLGLATVRRVVEILGGHIWAESSPGKGAKFTFSLPKSIPQLNSKS